MSSNARLSVVFARDTPVVVVLRRGPSKYVRLILWHTDTDTFEPGQWLKGTIDEHKAALSPNGKLLSYFAADYRSRPSPTPDDAFNTELRSQTELGASWNWVAVSRPPYLTALALWFEHSTHSGYTVFPDNQTLLLGPRSHSTPAKPPPNWLRVGETPQGWDHRMGRGWTLNKETDAYEKPLNDNAILLSTPRQADWKNGGPFLLNHRETGAVARIVARFADVDLAGRLIYAKEGKLFAAKVWPDLRLTSTELADFSAMTFEPIPPPNWANEWPENENS